MSKIMLITLLLFMGVANAGVQLKDCAVGSNPWFPGRQVDRAMEVEYVLTKPLVAESLNKEGKPSGLCRLAAGEHIVVPFGFDASISHPFATREEKMKLAWVKRCGNPIVSRFHFAIPQKAEATPVGAPVAAAPVLVVPQPVVPMATTPQVEAKPLLDGVDTEYGKTKTAVVPEPEKAEAPKERRVRVVVVQSAPRYYPSTGYYRDGYYDGPYGADMQRVVGGSTVTPAPSVTVPPPSIVTAPPVATPPPGIVTQ